MGHVVGNLIFAKVSIALLQWHRVASCSTLMSTNFELDFGTVPTVRSFYSLGVYRGNRCHNHIVF